MQNRIRELTSTRIRKLAVTTGIYDCLTDPWDAAKNGDQYSSVMPDLERFTHMILKECMSMLDNQGEETASAMILEHFGIENE